MSASDIWIAQQYKNKLAENNGYQIIEIWEDDYKKDKNVIKNVCLYVIKNKYKKHERRIN